MIVKGILGSVSIKFPQYHETKKLKFNDVFIHADT